MDVSVFLARVWGVTLIVLASAFIINQKTYLKKLPELASSPLFLFTGILAILLGIVHVVVHNIWSSDWRLLVTILGWSMLLKGIVRLFFPDRVIKFIKKGSYRPWYIPVVVFVLMMGVYLVFVGFFAS